MIFKWIRKWRERRQDRQFLAKIENDAMMLHRMGYETNEIVQQITIALGKKNQETPDGQKIIRNLPGMVLFYTKGVPFKKVD